MKKCHRCGTELADNARFCTSCAAQQPVSRAPGLITCPKCGFESVPGRKTCRKCGAELSPAQSRTPSPGASELPAPAARNPFAAPTAHVEDVRRQLDDTLADEPKSVGIGRGLAWWSGGWRLFRESALLWIGMSIVLLLINIGIGLVPIAGNLASGLIFPIFGAGLMLGCHGLDSGEELRFGHLFVGFQNNPSRLLMVGVLYLLASLAIVAVFFLFGFGGFAAAIWGGEQGTAAISGILLGGLIAALLMVPVSMSMWFAPALVALHELTALEAMKLSFRGCLRNVLPFLVYGLAGIVLAVVASIPLGLGWLALLPMLFGSTYTAYRDIFTNES